MARDRKPLLARWHLGRTKLIAVTAACLVLVGALTFLGLRVRQYQNAQTLLRPAGIPATVSTSLAQIMQLSPTPATAAPGFDLTDQAGHPVSLASLRGRVVVLEFMDPHCTDICPIVSREFIDAYHDLGNLRSRVTFVAVNVNQYHSSVGAMAQFTREQRLNTVPTWHFVTGSVPSLRAVWRDYDVLVQAPNPNADIIHSSVMYFIGPSGQERYAADPMVDHTKGGASYLPADQMADWGRGIALIARKLAG